MLHSKPFNLKAKFDIAEDTSPPLPTTVNTEEKNTVENSSSYFFDPDNVLEGCIEVPEDEWSLLQRGTYISYLRRDDVFRPGGHLVKQWIETTGPHKGIYHIKFIVGKYTWTIKYTDIERLWKNPKKTVVYASASSTIAPPSSSTIPLSKAPSGGIDKQKKTLVVTTASSKEEALQDNNNFPKQFHKIMKDQFTNMKILEKRINSVTKEMNDLRFSIKKISQALINKKILNDDVDNVYEQLSETSNKKSWLSF